MKKDEIHLSDIKRILIGQAPPEFLIETFFRTIIIYFLLLLIVRWLGKRMSGQLTIMEMAVMLTIGAIVSVPMQVPDRGLFQGLLLLLCTLLFQRGISLIGFRSGKFEDIIHGKTSLLVKDGILQLPQMKEDRISHQQLYEQLRQENILNLGEVERVYLEAEGLFSVFKFEDPKPGLSLLPPDDHDLKSLFKPALSANNSALSVCTNCGFVKDETNSACNTCGFDKWTKAVTL